jgi:uncharacterized protein YdhG (YjbR/CyaY superfamily)
VGVLSAKRSASLTKADLTSVDAYIAAHGPAARAVLETVRAALRRALPDAQELISYKIPAYRVGGRIAIWFAAWPDHYSLYPVSDAAAAALGEDVSRHRSGKGTLRFRLDEPVPEALIERVARANAARAAVRAPRRSTPSARARRRS